MVKYKLLDKRLITHKTEVYISKANILDMYKILKEDKSASGFIYGLEKIKKDFCEV